MTCGVAMEGSICRDGEGLNTHTLAAVMATFSAIRQEVWTFGCPSGYVDITREEEKAVGCN
jgi:hypothetical protein